MFGLKTKALGQTKAAVGDERAELQGSMADLAAAAERNALEAAREADMLRSALVGSIGESVELSVDLSELLCLQAWSNGNVRKLSGETVAISGSVEEMARTIQQIAELSSSVLHRSEDAARLVDTGADRAQSAGRAMTEIAHAFSGLDERMQVLGKAIESIGGFAKQIESISSQTKLLALNATIEAARAGEAGRGFAVVAAEVKALSEETSKTTELIRGQLGTLTGVMQSMLGAMQVGGAKVQDGQQMFSAVVSDMEGIRSCVGEVNGSIGSMSHMLNDQHMASESIAKSLTEISRLASQNETDSVASANLVRKADGAVDKILDSSAKAKVVGLAARRLRADHMVWKRNLAECLVGLKSIDPKAFAGANKPLGRGFDSLDDASKALPHYAALTQLADTMAREGGKMVAECAAGNGGKAVEHYLAMDAASGEAMTKMADFNRALAG